MTSQSPSTEFSETCVANMGDVVSMTPLKATPCAHAEQDAEYDFRLDLRSVTEPFAFRFAVSTGFGYH